MNNAISSNPWPGLGSYDDSGRYKFCGRNRATNELYSLISDNTVISLYGRSGIGKTSLLKAGVTPFLVRRGFCPVYVRLSQEEKTPDENGRVLSYSQCIVRCFERKMLENGFRKNEESGKLSLPESPDYLWSYFCRTTFLSSNGDKCPPVIILDQFEEIFQDKHDGPSLLMRQLYCLVDDSRRLPDNVDIDEFRSRFRFVMSFRDDSLYLLEDVINEYNLTAFKDNRYLLKALSRDEAKDVITEPGDGLVDTDVANSILEKVVAMGNGSTVDPAILSLLMYGLYDKMVQRGETSIQGTLVNGAGNDIVRSYYEHGMAEISLSARKYLEQNLISSDGRRRSLAAADVSRFVKDDDLKSLEGSHILIKLERGRFIDYELTHDVLCPIVAGIRVETEAKEKIARNKRITRVLTAIMAVVLVVVAIFIFQNKRLKEQRWNALGNQSRYVAEKAIQLAEDGDAYLAKMLLINTMPLNKDGSERPLMAESVSALGRIFNNESGILRGHTGTVSFASFSPDHKAIVSASGDNTVRIWDAATGVCLGTLEGHASTVYSASYSPDGKTIVSASDDNTVRIWDVATVACLDTLDGHTGTVYSALYSPDGKTIVSASGDGTVKIWDVATGVCLGTLEGHTNSVFSASYSPDGKTIVSASGDNTVRIWDAANGKCLHTLKGHTDLVNSATYSPDGKTIVSASSDSIVRIWDASTGNCLHTLKGHTYLVNSASYSPDGKNIVSASGDNTVRIWDASTGNCLHTLEGHTDWVNFASYSRPDGKTIVSASGDNTVRIWNVPTRVCLHTLEGHNDWVDSDINSTNGMSIVFASSDSIVRIWDASTGNCLHTLKGHTSFVNSASYSPNGRNIVSASSDNTVKIWDAFSGICLQTLEGHTNSVFSASFSPDCKSIVSAADDKTIKIWDASTGACLQTLEKNTFSIISASYSPDGRTIISVSDDNTVRICDAPPSFQEMLEKTRVRFKNRKLTPEERHRYHLD